MKIGWLGGAAIAIAAWGAAVTSARWSRRARLRGKVALVCGGSRGLGRAIAHELARRGCRVAVCARNEADLAVLRDELARRGADVYVEACDLRDEAQVDALVSNVTARLGPIDVLVANAATISVGPLETMRARDFKETMATTFDTALHPALAVAGRMRARRAGTIAFITSIGGRIGVPHLAPYCAAKFAEIGFAEALGAEIARDGVHVLTVVPGLMRTGSPVHGEFRGSPEKEYAWFAASANAPILSIDADRAARRVVSAIAHGRSELVYTLPARVVARTHGLVPGLWREAMRIAGRLLPRAPARPQVREGLEVERTARSRLVEAVSRRGRRYAVRHGQIA